MQITTTHVTLLERLGEGSDSPAWDEFYRRYGKLIESFATRQGLQAADAQDVVQDVLVALSRSMRDFEYDPSKGKFRSYLKTITLRAVFRKFRQKKAAPAQGLVAGGVDDALHDEEIDALWETEWRQYHLRQAMRVIDAEFNEQNRTAFRLYVQDGCSAAEVAEALGVSVDQVYQAKSRILKRLSELIAAQTADEG
ncbi:MAG: sigma-70 family RNA polymerase sigma factor [Phycisphaerales bacterium]